MIKKKKKKSARYKIVSLKDKIPVDQYLKEESGKALLKLTEMAKKAEQTALKKSTHMTKIKHRLHPSQFKYYPSPDAVKQKWANWHTENNKFLNDSFGFWKKVSSDAWNSENQDRESKMKT